LDKRQQKIQKAISCIQNKKPSKAKEILLKLTKNFPQDTHILYLLGTSFLQLERYAEATDCFNRVLTIDATNSDALGLLGACYKLSGNFQKAKETLLKALELTQASSIKQNLAAVYMELKDYYSASLYYKSAISITTPEPILILKLCHCLNERFLFNESLEYLNLLKEHSEQFIILKAIAYIGIHDVVSAKRLLKDITKTYIKQRKWSAELYKLLNQIGNLEEAKVLLSQTNDTSFDVKVKKLENNILEPSRILQYSKVITDSKVTKKSKIAYGFALANHYKKISTSSWIQTLHLANQLKREGQSYSKETEKANNIAIQKKYLDTSQYKNAHKSNTPIFIIGMPRSGTTLTEAILGSHSTATASGESLVMHYTLNGMTAKSTNGKDRLDFLEKNEDWDEKLQTKMANYYLMMQRKIDNQAKFIIDKMPHNFQYVGFINRLFPNAKIIHCNRSPIDTCLSIYEQNFNNFHKYGTKLEWLIDAYKNYQNLMAFWQERLPGNVLYQLNYEDLVNKPEENIRNLLNFCGLDFEQECLNFNESQKVVKTASVRQVRENIYASSNKRWLGIEDEISELLEAFPEYHK